MTAPAFAALPALGPSRTCWPVQSQVARALRALPPSAHNARREVVASAEQPPEEPASTSVQFVGAAPGSSSNAGVRRAVLAALLAAVSTFDAHSTALAAREPPALSAEVRRLASSAEQSYNEGDFRLAEKLWGRVVEQVPENAAAHLNLGMALAQQAAPEKLERAVEAYSRAEELASESRAGAIIKENCLRDRGLALLRLERFPEAFRDFDALVALDPYDVPALANRAEAAGGMGRWGDAVADLRRAQRVRREDANVQVTLAMALFEDGQPEEARRLLEGQLQRNPKLVAVRAMLATVLWGQSDREGAERLWGEVLEARGSFARPEWVRATLHWSPRLMQSLEGLAAAAPRP
eukprot:tig00000821_g4490.t1